MANEIVLTPMPPPAPGMDMSKLMPQAAGAETFGSQDPTDFDKMISGVGTSAVPVAAPTGTPSLMSELSTGVSRGWQNFQSSMHGMGGLLASTVGADQVAKSQFVESQGHEEIAKQYPATVPSYKDLSWGNALNYAFGLVGEQVPNILETAATTIAGTIIGGIAAPGVGAGPGAIAGFLRKGAIKQFVKEAGERAVVAKLPREAAELAAREIATTPTVLRSALAAHGKSLGLNAGMVAGTIPLEAGGNWTELMQEGIDAPWSSLATGTLAGFVELLGGANTLAKKILNPETRMLGAGLIGKVIGGATKIMLPEFGQEALQEILSITNRAINDPKFKPTAEELITRILDAGIAGAVVGGVYGGAGVGIDVYRERKATKATVPPIAIPEATGTTAAAAAVTIATQPAGAVDPYNLSPEQETAWNALIKAEEAGSPAVPTESYAVTPEHAPPGTRIRTDKHDFIVDSHNEDGTVTGKRIFTSLEGGLQGEVSLEVRALYHRALNEIETKRRTDQRFDVINIVDALVTTEGAPQISQEEYQSVIDALQNPPRVVTELSPSETRARENLFTKEPHTIPGMPNLTMDAVRQQNPTSRAAVVDFILAKQAEGYNVNSVVKQLKDPDKMIAMFPTPTGGEKLGVKFDTTKKTSLSALAPQTEDEIDAALDAGATYAVTTSKSGKQVVDYYPRDLRYIFRDRDYKVDSAGNKRTAEQVAAARAADIAEKTEILRAKLATFKKPDRWQAHEKYDDKGRVNFIGIARMVPEAWKSTPQWIEPKTDEAMRLVKTASSERRKGLASDLAKVMRGYLSSNRIAGQKVHLKPDDVNIAKTLQEYLDAHRDNISPEEAQRLEARIGTATEATTADMDALFGPAKEGKSLAKPLELDKMSEEVVGVAVAPKLPDGTLDLSVPVGTTFSQGGVDRSLVAAKIIEDLENYVRGKEGITESRFSQIVYNMLRFKEGRAVIDNFLRGNVTGAEVTAKAKAKTEPSAKAKELAKRTGSTRDKTGKVKPTDEQWNTYREAMRSTIGKIVGKDLAKTKMDVVREEYSAWLAENKKLTEAEIKAKIDEVMKKARDLAGIGTEKEGAVGKAAPAAKPKIDKKEEPKSEKKAKEKKAKEGTATEIEGIKLTDEQWDEYRDRIRTLFGKMTGADLSKEKVKRLKILYEAVKEWIVKNKNVTEEAAQAQIDAIKIKTLEGVSGVKIQKKPAAETKESLTKEEQLKAHEEAKAKGQAGFVEYQEIRAKAKILGVILPKGTKLAAAKVLVAEAEKKSGKNKGEVKPPVKSKAKEKVKKGKELTPEETAAKLESEADKLFGSKKKDEASAPAKVPPPTKPAKPSKPAKPAKPTIRTLASLPDNFVLIKEFGATAQGLKFATDMVANAATLSKGKGPAYEIVMIGKKYSVIKAKEIGKTEIIEAVVPKSKESELKAAEQKVAKQQSNIRTTIRDFLRIINLNRETTDQKELNKTDLESVVSQIHAEFRKSGAANTSKLLSEYAATKIRIKLGLSENLDRGIAAKLRETAVDLKIDLDTLEVMNEEINRGASREEELSSLINEQTLDASGESLEVTEIPNLDNLTGREIYEYMVKDVESRIAKVPDKVTRTQMRNMVKVDLSRTDTRWGSADNSLIALMDRFGKNARTPMSEDYRRKVRAYVLQMRMVHGRMAKNKVIGSLMKNMKAQGYSTAVIEDFIWKMGAPFYYTSNELNSWFKSLKNPALLKSNADPTATTRVRENWLWLGEHWALRKDVQEGRNKPSFFYMTEVTPEISNELGITGEAIIQAAEQGNSTARPRMGDTVTTVTTASGTFDIITKNGRNFVALPKDFMMRDSLAPLVTMLKQAGIDTANRTSDFSEAKSVNIDEAMDSTFKRSPINLTVESLTKELPGATDIRETSPGVFHVGFPTFSLELRNNEIQFYTKKDGEIVRINGRWKIREGGRPIIDISKLAYGAMGITKTLRHEIFHMVFDIYLTKDEQQRLLAMHRTSPDQTQVEVQEAMAEAYANWTPDGRIKYNPEKLSLFMKIMNGARNLFWKLHGMVLGKQYRDSAALFQAVRSGSVYARLPKLNLTIANLPPNARAVAYGGNTMPTVIKTVVSDPNRQVKAMWGVPEVNPEGEIARANPLARTIESTGLIDYGALESDELLQKVIALANLNENNLPYDRPLWKVAVDKLRKAVSQEDVGKQLSGKEVGRIEHYLSNPLFLATKFTEWAKAIAIEKKRSHNFQSDKYSHAARTVDFQNLSATEAASLDPIWVHGSAYSHKYLTEAELKDPAIIKAIYEAVGSKLTSYTLTPKAISGYLQNVVESKRVWAQKLDSAKLSMLKPYLQAMTTEEGAELSRLFKLLTKGEEPKNIDELIGDKKWHVPYEKDGKMHYTNNLRKAYIKLEKRYHEIQEKLSKHQYLDGYAPMIHGSGLYYVAVKRSWVDDKGNAQKEYIWSRHAKTEQHAKEMRAEVQKLVDAEPKVEGETYEILSEHSNRPEDSVYFMVGDMNMVRILDLAVAEIRNNADGYITMKQADQLMDQLTDAIVDIRQARGAGSSNISRKILKWEEDSKTVGGYQTQDFRDIWSGYFSGYYGMKNKFEASIEHMELLKEVKRKTPVLFEDLVRYAQDNMRNKDQYDRALGLVKNFVFYMYLGGKISTALLQLTQNFAVAIPRMAMEMHRMGTKDHMLAAEKFFLKAMWDIGFMRKLSPNVSPGERAMLEYMEQRGELMARFMQELKIAAASKGSKMMLKALEVLGWPMTYTEIFNRRSTALAYYRFLKARTGLSEQEVYDQVDDFIDKTHWWYGPANAPTIARGSEAFARLAQLSYTFRPFTHHYVLSLWYAFQNHGGTAGAIYAARSFAWLALLGGIPALPWIDDFIELVTKATGVPIRMEAQKMVRESVGPAAERFWAAGVLGLAGNVDLSAAIRPAGLPYPFSGTIGESTMGVYAGLGAKAARAIAAGKVGDWLKMVEGLSPTALENMVKAYRLAEVGQTTSGEKKVYGPNGLPIQLTSGEAFSQFIGIKGFGPSMMQKELWEAKVVQEAWKSKADKLHQMQRVAINNKDYEALSNVAREFTNYNLSIPQDLMGIVTPIKWAPPDRIDKKMNRVWNTFGTGQPS